MKYLHLIILSLLTQQNLTAQTKQQSDSIAQLDEVVVTGQYIPQSIRKNVYKVKTITAERIKQRAATNLIEALNLETGIRFSTDPTLGETDINILGMSGQNVKILLDGVPLSDRGSTKQSLSQIDINNVERIEIVEGPMSVVYGTDALAGVINIITQKNKKETFSVTARILEETTGSGYKPFYQDGLHNNHLGISWRKERWRMGSSFSRNSFGGWTGNALFPAQEAKPKDQYLGMINVGFQNRNTDTWYRLDYLNEDIFVAGPMNTNNYRGKDQHYLTNRYTHLLQNEWRMKPHLLLNTSLSYQNYSRQTETHIIDYTTGAKTASYGDGEWDRSTFKTTFLRSTLYWNLNEKIAVQPGIEIKSDKTSGQRISGTPVISDYSFFLSGEIKPTKKIQIKPGIRISKNSVYDAPPVVPSLNTKIALGASADLRLSYARGFRAPILRELYFYYFDANHSIQGNPDLKAESSDSYMASLYIFEKGKKLKWKASVTAFYNLFKNRIGMAAGQNNVFTYINIEEFKTIGASAEQTLSFDNLQTTIGFVYAGRYNRYATDPAFAKEGLPAFVWSPEANANLLYTFSEQKINLGLFYKFTGSLPAYQTRINTTSQQTEVYLTKIASFHWADLSISKTFTPAIMIQAGIKNLFDVTRLQNTTASGATHGGGGPVLTGFGRSFFAGITYTFNKKNK
jgi:outer membrane receptor for ferrienterochelin and colicins